MDAPGNRDLLLSPTLLRLWHRTKESQGLIPDPGWRSKAGARPRITEPGAPGAPRLQQGRSGWCGGEITVPSTKTRPDRVEVAAEDAARQENPPRCIPGGPAQGGTTCKTNCMENWSFSRRFPSTATGMKQDKARKGPVFPPNPPC